MGNANIRKWNEIQGMTIEGYEKRINAEEMAGGKPVRCINPVKTVEEDTEQNDGYTNDMINHPALEESASIRRILRELSLLQHQRKRYQYSHGNRYVEFEILEREWS